MRGMVFRASKKGGSMNSAFEMPDSEMMATVREDVCRRVTEKLLLPVIGQKGKADGKKKMLTRKRATKKS